MILGAAGIVAGAIAAIGAKSFPAYRIELERWGGALLLSGLTLIAFAFPFM